MQAQGHVRDGLAPSRLRAEPTGGGGCAALAWTKGRSVAIEEDFSPAVLDELAGRGHQLERLPRQPMFGGAQLIYRLVDGYCAASEPRKEGQAVGF